MYVYILNTYIIYVFLITLPPSLPKCLFILKKKKFCSSVQAIERLIYTNLFTCTSCKCEWDSSLFFLFLLGSASSSRTGVVKPGKRQENPCV